MKRNGGGPGLDTTGLAEGKLKEKNPSFFSKTTASTGQKSRRLAKMNRTGVESKKEIRGKSERHKREREGSPEPGMIEKDSAHNPYYSAGGSGLSETPPCNRRTNSWKGQRKIKRLVRLEKKGGRAWEKRRVRQRMARHAPGGKKRQIRACHERGSYTPRPD